MKSNFKKYKYCRFCLSKNIIKIIDLGNQPLAGGFLKTRKEFKTENKYPLELYFCKKCFLVQTSVVINRDILFKNYYYSSSNIKTLVDHFYQFGSLLKKQYSKKKLIVEIGSNDGVFLKILKKNGFKVLGIDPSENLTKPLIKKGLSVINGYFSTKLAKKIIKNYGQPDIIVSSNTLAHIENMHDVVNGIKLLLKQNGILIFENHYLINLIKENQYDMVYHEHQYYYSILTLINLFNKHDMEIFNVEKIPTHAGSIRVYVQNKVYGKNKILKSVARFVTLEKKFGVGNLRRYVLFKKQVEKNKTKLTKLIKRLKEQNKTIAGYGASGRGTILSNYCDLNNKKLDYVIDDSKIKQGLFTPGNHLRIISSTILDDYKSKPDYIVLFAWSFFREIVNRNINYIKNGGKFIVPLPKVKIISKI